MSATPLAILLIEDNVAEARFLQEVLKGRAPRRFQIEHVKRLGEGLDRLKTASFHLVLLDLTLPDSQGLASLDALTHQAPHLPVVVLTNTNDDALALEAVRQGAQDYLVKRQVNGELLVRSLQYAIERKQTSQALQEANEALERRVQERTAELARANDLLLQEVQSRQQAQERLELAQQAGKIGTFEWNIQSNQVTWSAELEALYGVPPNGFGGRYETWVQTLHPDDRTRTEQSLWQAVVAGKALDTEFRIVWPDGTLRWIAVKSSVFCNDGGTPLRMLGVHIDITEKKQFEAQFLQAQRLESLGTLASGIAHDLNNILTPILSITQLLPLKIPNLSEKNQQMLTTLSTSAKRGADLVKQILSFARGVEGKRVSLQVGQLLSEIRKILEETFYNNSIDINTQIDQDLWLVFADVTQIHQVLINLCVNARDAMVDGGTLTIAAQNVWMDQESARRHLDANVGPYVRITITDTGIGISPDIITRIFDPFFTTKDIGKGTGLGLSAVLGIIKSHGGFIDVQSEVNRGSRFQIYLPASQGLATQDDVDLEMLSGHQELILVVDHEAAICEMTKLTLETYNYRVLAANNAADAIALYAEQSDRIDGVLLDMTLLSHGRSLTIAMLRNLNPDVQVIVMNSLTSAETIAQAERLGAQCVIPKPFTTEELLKTLQAIQMPQR